MVEAVGDDKQALLTVRARVKFGPDAPEADAPGAIDRIAGRAFTGKRAGHKR